MKFWLGSVPPTPPDWGFGKGSPSESSPALLRSTFGVKRAPAPGKPLKDSSGLPPTACALKCASPVIEPSAAVLLS